MKKLKSVNEDINSGKISNLISNFSALDVNAN